MLRLVTSVLLILLAFSLLLFKGYLELSGPYLEALPPYPFCAEAEAALQSGLVLDALELAEAGGCEGIYALAQAEWDSLSANVSRCLSGILTGRGEGAAGLSCAIASDLVVFGDVRDLAREGLHLYSGEDVDGVLVALSAAGIALTFTPQLGAGTSVFKFARRVGTMSDGFVASLKALAGQRAWRSLLGLLGDAGRISHKVGPAQATRALRYADSAEELSSLARFVDTMPNPLLALRFIGKSATRIADDALYRPALTRGPRRLELAARRGTAALMTTQPLLVFVSKTVYKNPDLSEQLLLALMRFIVTYLSWPITLLLSLLLGLLGVLGLRYPRRRVRRLERSALA